MKTKFTLQELQSIPKQKWLDYVEKYADKNTVKAMYDFYEKNGMYRISAKSFGIFVLTFKDDKIWSDNMSRADLQKDQYIFERIIRDMNTLVVNLFQLSYDNPLVIANKVTEMLNELLED